MKKRILSILLVFCMMMSFVPITVFAAGGAKAILPGTSAQSILKIDTVSISGFLYFQLPRDARSPP